MRLAMAASDAAMEARAPDPSAGTPALAARVCVIVTDSPPTVHVISRGFPSNSSSSVTGWFSLTTWAPESADRDARVKQRASLVNVASKHGAGVRMDGRSALVLTNTRVESNVASLTGGGAHVTTGATLTLNGGEISANTAANGAGLACVGGEHGGGEIIGSGVVVRRTSASPNQRAPSTYVRRRGRWGVG